MLLTFALGHQTWELKPRTINVYSNCRVLTDTFDWLSQRPITWIKRSALSKQCKQAITAEPFLPCKPQVQMQVQHLPTLSLHILLDFHNNMDIQCSKAYLCPKGTSIMTQADLSNG